MLHRLLVVALFLSLGLDTLAVAVGLGISGLDRRDRIRFGLSFAAAEGIMPLVGLLLGATLARAVGDVAGWVAAVVLLCVGLYITWEGLRGEEREFRSASLVTLLATAASVSMDELAVGFGLGLLGISIPLAVLYFVLQALLVTWIGTALGRRVGEVFAERAEVAAGVVLSLLAVVLAAERALGGV